MWKGWKFRVLWKCDGGCYWVWGNPGEFSRGRGGLSWDGLTSRPMNSDWMCRQLEAMCLVGICDQSNATGRFSQLWFLKSPRKVLLGANLAQNTLYCQQSRGRKNISSTVTVCELYLEECPSRCCWRKGTRDRSWKHDGLAQQASLPLCWKQFIKSPSWLFFFFWSGR